MLSKTSFFFLLGIVVFLNSLCLFNEIMEPDGALYACLAKQIAKSDNWLDLWAYGSDWLDKPHLPFWLAAVSFKIFGISAFSYKLPSFIFFIISIIYCYKLSAAIYSKEVAKVATLIYATAIHTVISNFDGKVEIYLTAFIIGAIYHLFKAHEKKWFWHIVAASILSACAVMTKGIFSLIPVAGGFVIFWIKTKQWKEFLQPKWYLLILLTAIFILPELYSLYAQFDLHPEKIVFGKTNVSGLRFFFWDSQFGRFFNNGPIRGSGDLSFYLHTTFWAFLPWSIILMLAVINIFTRNNKFPPNRCSWIIGGSALIIFLVFSFSKFQLPHYIVIIFPQFAMITGSYLVEGASEKTLKKINLLQTGLFILLVGLVAWIGVLYAFNTMTGLLLALAIITIAAIFVRPGITLKTVLKKNIGFALLLSLFLNGAFYPALLQYQSGMMAAKWLNKNKIQQNASFYNCLSFSFDFYYKGNMVYGNPNEPFINNIPAKDSVIILSSVSNFRKVTNDTIVISILKTFPHFPVSRLNYLFLNHQTRYSALDTFAIAFVRRKINLK